MDFPGKRQRSRHTELWRNLPGRPGKKHYRSVIALLAVLGLLLPLNTQAEEITDFAPPASGHAANPQEIKPADVLARVNFATQQLDLIRNKLDLLVVDILPVKIEYAQPREVYFQALAGYRRTSRFTFEQLRVFHPDPVTEYRSNATSKRPYHVWLMVSRTSNQLSRIAAELNISTRVSETEADKETTPSDVYSALIGMNRQLDIMLTQPFSPSDVFQQVTLGVHYMARLLSRYPLLERIPAAPAYIENKQPSEVWLLLAECLEIIREIANLRDERLLTMDTGAFDANLIQPGDVYQFASLVVAELAFLHSIETGMSPVVPDVKVSNRVPSDVYQRVGLLHKQLQQLDTLSRNNSEYQK